MTSHKPSYVVILSLGLHLFVQHCLLLGATHAVNLYLLFLRGRSHPAFVFVFRVSAFSLLLSASASTLALVVFLIFCSLTLGLVSEDLQVLLIGSLLQNLL